MLCICTRARTTAPSSRRSDAGMSNSACRGELRASRRRMIAGRTAVCASVMYPRIFVFMPWRFSLRPCWRAHDREKYEIVCYSSAERPDAATERLQRSADGWRAVRYLSETQLTEMIRNDGIDISRRPGHAYGGQSSPGFRAPARSGPGLVAGVSRKQRHGGNELPFDG